MVQTGRFQTDDERRIVEEMGSDLLSRLQEVDFIKFSFISFLSDLLQVVSSLTAPSLAGSETSTGWHDQRSRFLQPSSSLRYLSTESVSTSVRSLRDSMTKIYVFPGKTFSKVSTVQ